ncbi:periplasmic secreted protein [Levilactobacillus namurensis DSM 19117]|uniref:Periplasmic secreted protein n=1 Tax=Levilactobacillus namurensis DSM 19117 TaxID=1423773 RepID=A0A0R1K1H5_9LACO|nr:DUF1440 domain-containing protein [Levilactobacillus namurensis]KRK77341.1 periplasmic secreted protein [Levilactobacillus namurensis DSM 19117]GEO75533.1 membrane protein [Levilactobacillus namurensis]HJE46237.1 DUF1440 domain-containing protein [Levilactobacillus namurensis]
MSFLSKRSLHLPAAIIAGTAAGVVSGLVKLGWENVLPPRTEERDATNPPQTLLQQFGVPAKVTHATYHYSGHELPWVSYVIHFGFSTTFAVLYQILGEKIPAIKKDAGTWFGLAIWVAFHLGIMPAMGTVPSAKEQPEEEHVSEALGHVIWMVTNDLVGDEVYRRLVAQARK